MKYIPGKGQTRPNNFGNDQRVYTWNGTLRCVHCHRITEGSKCPHDCPYWVELGFNLETGIGHCEDCNGEIRLGAPATSDKGNSIHPDADSFTVFGINTADGLKTGITCTPCADVRLDETITQGCSRCGAILDGVALFSVETVDGQQKVFCTHCTDERTDEKIAEGELVYSPETDSWFSPEQFPDKTGYKIGDLVPPDEEHPTYRAIEASIEAGEAFQCAYCGITDDIDQLDLSHPGAERCLTCADKHQAATYTPW